MAAVAVSACDRRAILSVLLNAIDSSDEEELEDSPLGRINEFMLENHDEVLGSQLLKDALPALERKCLTKVENYVEFTLPECTDEQFITHFRVRRRLAQNLAERFQETATFQALMGHGGFEAISPEKHVVAFLWFAGHQSASFRDVADRFNLSLAGLHGIVTRMMDFLLAMREHIIRMPTQEQKEETKNHYLNVKGLPGILCSIDGSHIRIDKPHEDQDAYCNRKRYFSLHLQGVVSEQNKFLDVVAGWPGSVHDARVFANSPTKANLERLCGRGEIVLGDAAYPCLPYLITPYRDNGHLTRAQKLFNKTLSSCRISVEHAFGILKQRFRQLYFLRWRSIRRMVRFIIACCVLHNLADQDDVQFFEPPEQDDIPDPDVVRRNQVNIVVNDDEEDPEDNMAGKDVRDELCRQLATRRL